MSYEKQTWNKYDELKTEEENIENGAVVTDNRMNHMESGIGDNDANLASHLADKNNPHKVTAAQVGLGNVQNFGLATEDEAKQGISNAKYMTPSLTQAVLSANINSIAYANSADGTDGFTTVYPNLNLGDNTKTFAGAEGGNNLTGSIRIDSATQKTQDGDFYYLTAKAPRSSYDWFRFFLIPDSATPNMTKVTVKPNTNYTFSVWLKGTGGHSIIAYNAWTNPTNTGYDINLTSDWKLYTFTVTSKDVIPNNPVQFFIRSNNGTEINLKKPKVEQGPTATPWMPSASEVTTADRPKYVGFSNTVKTNKSASDYTWFPVKDSELTNKVDSHINNKANPHSVTASQVGAYSKDESDQKLAAQKQAIDSHVNNKANPHAVTASQVGAYSKQEIDTKLSKAVMADDSGKVSIGTLDSNTLTVQGTKIYPNTKDGVWTVEKLFDNEYRLTTVMSTGADVTSTWNSLFISSEIPHPNLPSGYTKTSWGVTLSNSNNLMWCSISGASVFRLIAGASTSAATRTVIVTVYASK